MKDLSNPTNKELDEILKPLRRYSISIAFEQELEEAKTAISKLLEKQDIKSRISELEKLKFVIDGSILSSGTKFDYSFFETAIKLHLLRLKASLSQSPVGSK